MNDRIRAPQVRLIGHDGQQIGVMATKLALDRARELDLDLVEVAPLAEPPVCRLMDFGKWKYEQDVRAKEARKRQSQVVVKEMKFRPKISTHDYEVKRNHVRRFLEEGSKVKITIMFRGREMAHTELGAKLLDRLGKDLANVAGVELMPKLDGRNMTMVMAPFKRPDKLEKAAEKAAEKAVKAGQEAKAEKAWREGQKKPGPATDGAPPAASVG
ncbi:MAG: translation initiation factor IF-3 [Actinomycetota bacterium]